MTKDEILALIENTISGQGSQVDIGGKLAAVLSNIVNLIPEGGGSDVLKLVDGQDGISCKLYYSEEDSEWSDLTITGITTTEIINAIKAGKVVYVVCSTVGSDKVSAVSGFIFYEYDAVAAEDTIYFYYKNQRISVQ